MQKILSSFAGGWPGIGLLLLRAAIGLTILAQGIAYLADGSTLGVEGWGTTLVLLISGVMLVIGYLTPLACALAGLTIVATTFTWIPAPDANLLVPKLVAIRMLILAVAIACLGPGAFSLDARLYGHREIVIPGASHPSRPSSSTNSEEE